MLDSTGTHINYESELYQEFYKSFQYCLGSYHVKETAKNDETITPLLFEVEGND